MFQQNKFDLNGTTLIEEQVIEWTEQFFCNMMNLLNSFYSKISLEETINSLKGVDFTHLVLEQLEDESDEIKSIATARITELAEAEIAYLEAYST